MPEDEANKKPMSPAQKRASARAEREHRDTQWGRFDAKLGMYFSFEDNNKSEFISARITAPPEASQRARVPGRVSSS